MEEGNDDDDFFHLATPSRLVLANLAQAGNLDRLIAEARRFLEQDPEDFDAHYFLALGLTDDERYGDAWPHVAFVLQARPESSETLFAAVHWFAAQNRWREARPHIREGMRVDPEEAFFHRYAAIDAASRMRIKEAKAHIDRARQLAPDDPDIVNLHIRIHGADETSLEDAYKRLHEYEEALRLDPHSAELHNSIGDVYLDEIDDPVKAETHYREAVLREPGNRLYQRDLFQAVAKRSLVYRIFSIPSRTFRWLGLVGHAIRYQPWRIIFLLIGIKFVLGFFLWLMLATILFYPGGKIYEWLLVSEIKRGADASLGELRAWHWFRRWPLWARFSLFLFLNLGIWAGLFLFLGIPLEAGFFFVAVVGGFHALIVGVLWGLRRLSAARARRKMERNRTPPPLPTRRSS